MTDQLPLLTTSRLTMARACQRKHKHRYIDGYVPLEDAAPLRFGTIFHAALAEWWLHTPEFRLDYALRAIPQDADPYEAAMARALMVGYDARWAGQEYETIAVEQEFRVPLVNPETGARSKSWDLGGKIDVLAREAAGAGRVGFVEHKTTSEDLTPGSTYWKRLRLDGQVSIYFEGGRALGYEVEFCLYDVIGKPGLRPLKATPVESRKYTKDGKLYAAQRERDETPEEYEARLLAAIAEDPARYYARGEVVRLDGEVSEAMYDIWTLAQQLRAAQTAGKYPRNPGACVMYGRTCPYFGVCTGEQRLDDEFLFKQLTNVHPELLQVATQPA